jgi:hypothetical protein
MAQLNLTDDEAGTLKEESVITQLLERLRALP